MNDWLTYKASGSSRAYMGETMTHGLFGIQTKKEKEEAVKKQQAAEKRLEAEKHNRALQAQKDVVEKARKEYDHAVEQYNMAIDLISESSDRLKELERDRKAMSSLSPLKASQQYSARIKNAQDNYNEGVRNKEIWAARMSEAKNKLLRAQEAYDNLRFY